MKNTSKIIGLITFILVALSAGIGVFVLKAINQLNSGFTENYILVSLIVAFVAFLIAIASNLISFLITYFYDQKHINEMHYEVLDRITQMEPHIKPQSIILCSKDRNSLSGTGFFDKIYNNASDIRISGIKLTSLIDYICKKKKSNNNWVKNLRNREGVTVKILMSSPKSTVIPALERQEQSPPNTIVNKIEATLKKLSDFSKSNKNNLAVESSISIRITDAVQHFNITYAGNRAKEPTDKLLIGFLFNKDDGPIYEIIQTEVSTHSECLSLFDELFKNGTEIFRWDENGTRYT